MFGGFYRVRGRPNCCIQVQYAPRLSTLRRSVRRKMCRQDVSVSVRGSGIPHCRRFRVACRHRLTIAAGCDIGLRWAACANSALVATRDGHMAQRLGTTVAQSTATAWTAMATTSDGHRFVLPGSAAQLLFLILACYCHTITSLHRSNELSNLRLHCRQRRGPR